MILRIRIIIYKTLYISINFQIFHLWVYKLNFLCFFAFAPLIIPFGIAQFSEKEEVFIATRAAWNFTQILFSLRCHETLNERTYAHKQLLIRGPGYFCHDFRHVNIKYVLF